MFSKILEVKRTEQEFKLVWHSKMLTSWVATIERVQLVVPIDENSCDVKNWESMGGLAAYALKYGTGVTKQLQKANIKYLDELVSFLEKNNTSNVLV
jgi:hypothetical protein